MNKYLSIPVTSEGDQLVPVTNVKLIEAASTTSTTINYGSSKVITITHAAVPASSTKFRNFLQTEMVAALSLSWTNVTLDIKPAYAVSNIDIA
tara:strand:- start:1243 stop:1521 length:279 start_codon:yes stop_codon:yes gene_type:complete